MVRASDVDFVIGMFRHLLAFDLSAARISSCNAISDIASPFVIPSCRTGLGLGEKEITPKRYQMATPLLGSGDLRTIYISFVGALRMLTIKWL